MPPARYVYIALGLIGLFVLSFKVTMGLSIFLFYGMFWVMAGVLALGGIVRCGNALGAPPWATFGLISPVLVKLGTYVSLYRGGSNPELFPFEAMIAPVFELLAAVAAVRIIEVVYERTWLTVAAYFALAALLVFVSMKFLPIAALRDFLRTAAGRTSSQAVSVVDAGVRWAVFAGAAVAVFTYREIEFWIVVAIAVVGLEEFVWVAATSVAPLAFGGSQYGGMMFWLRPAFLAVGAAAIWRAGETLRTESRLRALRDASYGR